MSLVKYHPRHSRKQFGFSNLWDEFLNNDFTQFVGRDSWASQAAVNVKVTDNSFVLEVSAPGFKKEDFALQVEKDHLKISGKVGEAEEGVKYTRREFKTSDFERTFRLPKGIKAEGIKAAYEAGILTVELPKAEEEKAKTRTIEVL